MSLLSFENLGKTFGVQVCFLKATDVINPGDRIGLIGANGTGKTTFAKVLCGMLENDEGVVRRKKGLAVEYLSQDPDLNPAHTLHDEALDAFADILAIEAKIDELAHRMAEPDVTPDEMEKLLDETGQLQTDLETRGGYTLESRCEAVLMGLGFDRDDFEKPIAGLSGGERSRLGLAKVLLRDPELLILDEPTNHLDISGVQWLENFLRSDFKGAALIISHDRYFLDQVVTRIFEIERGTLESWAGNYTRSRELKAEKIERLMKEYAQQQQYIAKQQEFIRRFKAGQRSREAKGRDRRLQRFIADEALNRPDVKKKEIKLNITTERRVGSEVCEARDLRFEYPGQPPLFAGLNLEVRTNEVLGIVGPNGAGKTTFVRCLIGELQPTGGSVRFGSTIHHAFLHQREEFPDSEQSIIDFVHDKHPRLTKSQLRDVLAALLFTGDDIEKPLNVLSGGEKKRVALVDFLLGDANLIFMDEPTNHLDLPAREALEEALAQFPGTLVIISHDRYLLDRLADRILWLAPTPGFARPAEPGDTGAEWRVFPCNYTEMVQRVRHERLERAERAKEREKQEATRHAKSNAAPAPAKKAPAKKKGFKGSMEELEAAIEALSAQILDVETELGLPETYDDPERVKELTETYDTMKAELETLEAEWLERAE